jgi:hypothetical protein
MRKILAEIKYFGKDYIRIPVRNFRTGISNLWRWLPIVWKDRDWDNHFLMEPIIFKLKKHIEYQKLYSHVENAPEQIRTMTECLELLEKVHDEWTHYEEHSHDEHKKKWGEAEHYTEPCEDRPGSYRLKDRREERMTPEDIKQMHKEWIEISIASSERRKADFKKAMDIFVEHYDSWWD